MGEGAHYIRKTREKKVQAQMPKKASKEHAEDMLISEKSKNGGLLKRSGVKNKNLIMDDKNDVLLDKKKVKAFKLKPVQVKKVKRKKL